MSRFLHKLGSRRYRVPSRTSNPSDGMRRVLYTLGISLALGLLPDALLAQTDPLDVRTAGDATKFRVIQRIPAPTTMEVAELAWPYPDNARQAIERDDWVAAWAALEKLPQDPDERFGFVWSWAALGANANEQALKGFQNVAARDGLLVDYAHLYAAEAAFRTAQHEIAVTHAAKVTPKSVPHRAASLVMARALVESGEEETGIRALRAFIDAFSGHDDASTARFTLARALHKQGKHTEAAQLLVRTRIEDPLWDGFDEAFTALESDVMNKLSKKERAAIQRRDEKDWITEHRVRFRAHDSQDVIDGLARRVLDWKKKSSERCEGLFLVGNSYTKLRKHSDSTPWYERIISECKGDKHYIRALYKGGKGYWNAGKKTDAIRLFEKMWTEFPKHSYADDGMFFASRVLVELNKENDATKLLQRQVKTYPDGDMAADAHWGFVREYFAKKKYAEVVKYVDALSDTGERDLYSQGRLAYFKARALELAGNGAEARKAYGEVVQNNPMGYYTLFALNRLANMVGGNAKDICQLADGALCNAIQTTAGQPIGVDQELRTHMSFRRGTAFLQVALDGFAQLEFKRLYSIVGDDPERLWTLAGLLDAAGAYPYSHDIPRRKIDDWETFYPDRERAQRWRVAYPAPFATEVKTWAKKRDLPPELVWGIMREESGFNPRIRSWAGAIGLMQVMPGTAKVSARKDNFTGFSVDLLTNPDDALRIGTAYLDELGDESGDHPVLMISGYNGGWGNVGRWLEKPDSRDLDLWVEDIPYGQTRHYTKRVLRSMWIYSWLYGDTRIPRFELKVPKGK